MVARSAVAVLVAAILVVGSSCDASVTPCGVGVCAVDLLWRRVSTGGKWDPEGVNATRNMMKGGGCGCHVHSAALSVSMAHSAALFVFVTQPVALSVSICSVCVRCARRLALFVS